MWREVKERFSKQRGRMNVVKKMIELGLRVGEDGRIYVGDVEVSDVALARAAGVDRRVVRSTVKQILGDEALRDILTKVKPVGASLVDVASRLGFQVLVVEADPKMPGVIASVTSVLARYGVVVRQALADDPDLAPEPRLTLVVQGEVPAEALSEVRSSPLVKSLKILK